MAVLDYLVTPVERKVAIERRVVNALSDLTLIR